MGYNSKYKSSEIEELLDQMSSGQSNIFLWNWNMAASGQLGDGEFNKLKESSIVLIGAGTSDANYYVPMVRSADDNSIVLSVHTESSEGLGNLVFSFNVDGSWTMETEELTFVTEEQLDGKQDELISGTNIKTINGESILGSGDLTIEGDEDIIVTNKSDLDELYKDVPEGTKAVVVNKASDVLGVNLFDVFMGTIEGVEEVLTQPEAYTLRISSVDTNVELPISDTSAVRVTLPFDKSIHIDMGSDLASVYRILVGSGYSDLVWSKGVWMGADYLLYNEISVSQFLTLDENAIAGLIAISPALIVDFVGTKTITEYIKNGDNWEVWSEGESVLNTKLNAFLGQITQFLPTKTSQLENDSNFISSDNLKTINGQSIVGSGDITIQGGGAAVDNVYITDFTVNDLDVLIADYNNYIQASIIELQNAITAHKVVLVPYDANEGFNGYGVATGYLEDLLYVTITVDNGRFIDLELTPNSTDIKGQEVRERVWDDKQSQLVSGTNIKTINGESILGSGDIEISGGSGGGGKEYVEAPLLTEPMGTSIMFTGSVPLEPNKVYVAKKKVAVVNLNTISTPGESIGYEYTIMFQSSTSELSISGPIQMLWANGTIPTIEADTYYELSLVFNNINNKETLKAVLTPFKPVE